jgi:hypothetical protein
VRPTVSAYRGTITKDLCDDSDRYANRFHDHKEEHDDTRYKSIYPGSDVCTIPKAIPMLEARPRVNLSPVELVGSHRREFDHSSAFGGRQDGCKLLKIVAWR